MREVVISSIVSLVVLTGALVFDLFLELGQFSGLVFVLYSYIGLGIVFIGIVMLGFFEKKWFFASIVPVGFALILYVVSLLVQ